MNIPSNGTIGDPHSDLISSGLTVCNVICAIVFGDSYDENDPEFKDVIRFNKLTFRALQLDDPAAFIPM